MCGRNSLFIPQSDLEDRLDADVASDVEYRPRYNIAPGSSLEVVTNEAPGEIVQHHWGLLPFWADEIDDGYINARSETAHEKRAFKNAWEKRPCLVLSSGFYEWQQTNGGPKQPYRVYREGDDPTIAMAGLWQTTTIGNEDVQSVTILTTDPNDVVAPIHDRMPVVLPEDEEQTWLSAGPDERRDLCHPYPDNDLDAYPISTLVNNPSNDDARVIEPAETE